ncbi:MULTISPECIES: type II CAAX endopeptidase family protein [unclassified Novosphingobium]|uniref:CPBP family intramembrane glutamic endopeptidase n=1 Tax=unclassified Novosphingobium TaxID=2644732 RepID=UPI0025DA3310|nr:MULTISPECIES: type II CAAX endopeptidase family protein [unclassified Novosphingobium]HQV04002.1 type II CAAX endopeptidase family protein [Novosphingobium sp.]
MDSITHPASTPSTPSLLRRIVAFPLTLMIIGFVWISVVAAGVGQAYQQLGFARNTPEKSFGAVLMAVAVVLGYKAYKRWIERAEDTELPLSGAMPELAAGIAIGTVLFSLMTGIVALMGGIEFLGLRGAGQIWTMLAIAVVSGTMEEVLFRGIVLRHMETLIGTWGSLAFTSALFGALHITNPDATWFSSLAIALEAGILLGAAYLLTRRLWLAIGIHAAWNFTQGWIFSVPVSGGEAPLGLLITRRIGPDWLTGGDFGLEASVVAMVVATLAGLALLAFAVRRGQVVAPMWRRGKSAT